MIYDESAKKKPTNVSINEDLLERARGLGLNLSKTLEEALVDRLAEAQRDEWLSENRKAIERFNQRVARTGSFGDRVRRF